MALKDTLKTKIPQFQQGNPELDDLLDAVGELLDNFKLAINDFQNYNDFQLVSEKFLPDLAAELGIKFPRNMSIDRQRAYLREVVTLYRSTGTKNSMKRMFRLIGWDVEIDEYYIVDPLWYQSHASPYTLTNESGATFDLELYDKIHGHNWTYKNSQVFVDLEDSAGNTYPKKQITGQKYEVAEEITFVKVPYIKIIIKSEDYDIFTSDYVENETLYTYDSSEEFDILEQIKTYFLERIRPANVAIVDISTPFGLSDTITSSIIELNGLGYISTSMTFDATTTKITIGTNWADSGFVDGEYITIAGTVSNDETYKIKYLDGIDMYLEHMYTLTNETISAIGTATNSFHIQVKSAAPAKYDGTLAYGVSSDRYVSGETFGGIEYTTGAQSSSSFRYYPVNFAAPDENYTQSYASPLTGNYTNHFRLRKTSTVTIDTPSVSCWFYATKMLHLERINGGSDWDYIGHVSASSSGVFNLEGYHSGYCIIGAVFTGTLDIEVDLL